MTDLAKASEEEILRVWQGLGYYSRARNLHKCAKIIMQQHNGKFPGSMKELLLLPGIGRYTAAAIASLAFAEPVPVVDGNVFRLLARYYGIDIDISSSKAYQYFYQLSLMLIDASNPGDYNQAVMEFGALYCTPKQPDCNNCVLKNGCVAKGNATVLQLPVKKKKLKVRERFFYYFIIRHNNKVLMHKRTGKDIWQGLFEFMLIEQKKAGTIDLLAHPALSNFQNGQAEIEVNDKIIRHLLTHQLLYVNFAVITVKSKSDLAAKLSVNGFDWYDLEAIGELPKPILISNFLDSYMNSINLQ